MKRYSTYKDSGVKWIGEIPSHWKIKSLRNFISITSDKGHPKEQLLSVVREQGVIIRNVDSKEENHNFIPDDLSGYKLVKEGQLVINKMKAWQGSYAVSNFRGIVSPAYYTCNLKFSNKDFFNEAIRSKAYVPFFTQYSKGIRVGQWDLSPIGLKEIPFFLPTETEQRAIVSFLDTELGKIDTYVDKEQQLIERLKELKQSVIARAVTRGINPNVRMKPSGVNWIGEIPEHWEVKRLGSFFVENRSVNSNLKSTEAYKFNYGSLVRKDENVDIKEVEETYRKYTFINERDIVINGLNLNYDFVSQRVAQSYNKGIITSAYLVLTPREGVNDSFYCYLFKAMDNMKLFHSMGTGIRLTLSFRDLKSQQLPVPPLSEQRTIVDYISSATSKIDKLISEKTKEMEYMKELRQRIISDAVTGKIDVRE